MTDVTHEPGERWRRVAEAGSGPDYAQAYAARFDELAEQGQDVHGEAAFVSALVPGGAVLDAGCGTGRVAARLDALGHEVMGVDVDAAMIAVARERRPDLTWAVSDLALLDLGRTFDAVVLAGNVIPFLESEDLLPAVAAVADHLRAGGLVVAGFGLDADHLPSGAREVALATYDEACATAGLVLVGRWGGWQREEYVARKGYAVSVHRLP